MVDNRCQTTLTGCSFISFPSLIVSPRPKNPPSIPSGVLFFFCRNVGLAWAAPKMQSRINALGNLPQVELPKLSPQTMAGLAILTFPTKVS
jgi:hypothetical protein